MAITEEQRHNLHSALEEVLGPKEANVLMSHLPPVGWADVVTKTDLDLRLTITEQTMRAEMADLRAELSREFGGFRDEIHRDRLTAQRQMLFVLTVALLSLVVAVATG